MTLSPSKTVLSFTHRWRGLDQYGRRATGPKRWHLTVSGTGWATALRSRGHPPPQHPG